VAQKKVTGGGRWLALGREVISTESRAVARLASRVDAAFLAAARLMASARGRVIVMGVGKSGLIGRKLAATLSSTGTPAFFVHPVEGLHGDLGMLTAKDVVLALSHSGETEEVRKVLPFIAARRIPLVALTGRPRSTLGRAARAVVDVSVDREACPYNITPTASTAAALAMGDALALVIMGMKGFDDRDFARLHPAGALGKRLTLTVADLMHKGADNPVIRETRPVRDALAVMTRTRLGAASAVDARGRLSGVFTDGDLRRGLQRDPGLLGRPLSQVMTRRPKTLKPGLLAAQAAPLFRDMGLDNFPVVDAAGRPLGVLDEKDLLDEGLA
jgi:arabinose-5-phosphate isomerase